MKNIIKAAAEEIYNKYGLSSDIIAEIFERHLTLYNEASSVREEGGQPTSHDNTAFHCCDDPIVFEMQDRHHKFAMGLCTILECLIIAERRGHVPKLPDDWRLEIRNCDTLSESKIQVTTVAGLLGDSRLVAEPQMIQKLSKALKRSDIELKAKDIAAVLSRGQVNTLIDILNTRGKNEQRPITEGIQRVLNSRIARHMGQDSWRGAQGGAGRIAENDDGREESGAGVSFERGGSSGRGNHQNGYGKGVDELTRKEMEAERRRQFEEREAARQAKRDGLKKERGR